MFGEANRFDTEANPLAKPYASVPDARFEAGDDLGPYRIVRLIGRGGMGEVYEAAHSDHGRRVALKVLARPIRRPADRARFLAEGQAAARISHPHSVFILEAAELGDLPVIAMELLPGDTLQERVHRFGPLSSEQAVDATLQIVAGLDAAWSAGILHRDVKPGNCLIDRDGTIKIGDFGLSLSPAHPAADLIVGGGTPAFASPEQLRGEPVTVRSDIYAVGATLWFLLTGKPPIDGPELSARMAATERGIQPLPKAVDAPEGLRVVLAQMLACNAADRPASYAELTDALAPFSSAARRRARRARGIPAAVLDGIIALPAVAMVAAAFTGDPHTPQPIEAALVSLLLVGFFWARVHRVRARSRDELVARTRMPGASPRTRDYLAAAVMIVGPMLFGTALAMSPRWFPQQPSRLPLTLLIVGVTAIVAAPLLRRRSGLSQPARDRSLPQARARVASHDGLSRPGSDQSNAVGTAPHTAGAAGDSAASSMRSPADTHAFAETPEPERYGPFEARTHSGVTSVGELLEAWDPLLRRRIWIHRVPPGTPRLSPAARHATRGSRLRWLQDHRASDVAWDAFEAPDGAALVWMQQASAWSQVRGWLTDLAEELEARESVGEARPSLSLDRVWVTASGRGILLDFAVPLAASVKQASVPADTTATFLHHAAKYALRQSDVTLPLSVSRLLQQLRSNQLTTREAIASLQDLESVPDGVTRHQRTLSLMMSGVVASLSVFAAGRAWLTVQATSTYVPPGLPELASGLESAAATSAVTSIVPLALGMAVCMVAASMVAAIYRGGFWLDALGIAVVNDSGTLASRTQVMTRALIGWSWMPLQIIMLALGGPAWVVPACVVVAGVEALRCPSRSLPDRLLGTVLVPR